MADLLATPGPAMDYLHPPVPTILIYPLTPPSLFRVDPWRTEGGGCISVLVRWAAGVY